MSREKKKDRVECYGGKYDRKVKKGSKDKEKEAGERK